MYQIRQQSKGHIVLLLLLLIVIVGVYVLFFFKLTSSLPPPQLGSDEIKNYRWGSRFDCTMDSLQKFLIRKSKSNDLRVVNKNGKALSAKESNDIISEITIPSIIESFLNSDCSRKYTKKKFSSEKKPSFDDRIKSYYKKKGYTVTRHISSKWGIPVDICYKAISRKKDTIEICLSGLYGILAFSFGISSTEIFGGTAKLPGEKESCPFSFKLNDTGIDKIECVDKTKERENKALNQVQDDNEDILKKNSNQKKSEEHILIRNYNDNNSDDSAIPSSRSEKNQSEYSNIRHELKEDTKEIKENL